MNRKAVIMASITILIWGSTFAAIRASLQGGYDAGHLVLVRYLIASSLFLLYALWPKVSFKLPHTRDLLRIVVLGWVGISLYHIGVTFGMKTVTAGTAGMLIGAAPIFTALIALIGLKERPNAAGWIGLIVGFTGILLITLGTSSEGFSISTGAFFVLMAAVATSIFFVFQKPLLMRYGPIELTAYFTWAGTIPFFLFAPGLFTSIQQASLEAHLAALFVGIFPAGIAYVTWAIALSNGNAGAVTSMMYAEPVIAVIVAWLWLSEWPAALSLIGGAVALSGVLIVQLLGSRDRKINNKAA
ncbi:DMT family transporter [Alkalihalophilus marmarensis]|uniref:DMT family transporter n=1 Tax=Alkalihalophilus marmarensis TaxID=521377 RepID=UPI002E245867|nr:DMT family transporter [Alkalihalophilus marmarensis]